MLTNIQIEDLAQRMKIPLEFVGFKSSLPKKLKTNKAYIINLDDEVCEDTGIQSGGTHWTCFQVMEYPNGKKEGIYFDSFGVAPPEIVKERIMSNFKMVLPYNTKDVQSLLNQACGWYCLALLHFINAYANRTKQLYWDVEEFLSLFEDLNKSIDFKKNEYILKMFFQPEDESKRQPIEVISEPDRITDGCGDRIDPDVEGAEYDGHVPISVDIKYI
jgi:hypothetical protein